MSTVTAPRSATQSVHQIRASFPALERAHRGYPVAYFDGPGGTQVPRQVVQAVEDYLYHHNANTHWPYPTSEETDALLLAARQALADLLNARPSEIAFGANMFVSAIAAACGVAAYLAGMPAIAMSAIAIGIFGDLMIGRGVAPSTAELVVGAGLVAAGAACLLQERWSA